MAIEYKFLDRTDEDLIATSELPVEGGIAVAIRTTGYEIGTDEIVELSIVDLSGEVLFSQVVKPQNIEEWSDAEASGGIMPADVADSPELYQFEDEIIGLFEKASVVVGQHAHFIHEMIESSWVSLPPVEEFDLLEQFCASHCTTDYPGQPAAVATLEGIADYYGLPVGGAASGAGTVQAALTLAAGYVKLVDEHADERAAKGEAYWQEYERRLEEARRSDKQLQAAERSREIRTSRTNAIMWLCSFAIFSNLAVQLYLRSFDISLVVIAAAVAVFSVIRWIRCLYRMSVLRKQNQEQGRQE